MKSKLFIAFFLIFAIFACKKVEMPIPTVDFSFVFSTNGVVEFTNNSQNADSYQWDFGDGEKSTEKSPKHSYNANGKYNVTLTATGTGGVKSATNTIQVSNIPAVVADFSYKINTSGCVQFINTSQNADTYSWVFVDNNTSTTKEPQYCFSYNDNYDVTLTAKGKGSESKKTQTISITNAKDKEPIANFAWVENNGVVTFNNKSQYGTTYSWDFGDGSPKNTQTNPIYTYKRNQKYNVVLTTTGKGGTNTKTIEIEVKNAPIMTPMTIYISKVTVTQLGYYTNVNVANNYKMVLRRRDNAGYVEIFKSQESYPEIKVDNRYEYSKNMPFKINYPERIHHLWLVSDDGFGYSTISSLVYFDGEQPLVDFLHKKSFPQKVTISDVGSSFFSMNASLEVEFKYDY